MFCGLPTYARENALLLLRLLHYSVFELFLHRAFDFLCEIERGDVFCGLPTYARERGSRLYCT